MQTAQLLEQLYNGKALKKEESAVIFNAIMQGELNNEQIAAMLIEHPCKMPNHSLVLTTLLRILWVLAVMVKTRLIFLLLAPLLQPLWVQK